MEEIENKAMDEIIKMGIVWDGKYFNVELPDINQNFFTTKAEEILTIAQHMIWRDTKIKEA